MGESRSGMELSVVWCNDDITVIEQIPARHHWYNRINVIEPSRHQHHQPYLIHLH